MTDPVDPVLTTPVIEELLAENTVTKPVASIGQRTTTLYLVSIIVLCLITVGFVLAISVLRPEQDNMNLIILVIGVIGPLITALLAAAVQQVHLAVNSRLSQLLKATAIAAAAKGALVEREKLIDRRLTRVVAPPATTSIPPSSDNPGTAGG